MKYLDEFSDPDLAGKLIEQIKAVTTRRWSIMEVCGGQTHSIIRRSRSDTRPRFAGRARQHIELEAEQGSRTIQPYGRSAAWRRLLRSRVT